MSDTQAAVCSSCSRTGCNGVQFQRADPSYGWEVGYLKECLDSEATEAMHRLVLMMAKSLHHVGSAQLGLSQPGSNFFAKWLPSGTNSLPSGLCQLSQVLEGARVIMCGQWKHLATSRAGPSQSRCSLGAGVLGQIMCRLNPDL